MKLSFSSSGMQALLKWLVPVLVPVVGVLLLLAGLFRLGWLARDQLRDDPRYRTAFADIQCQPPPGMTREDFLKEVQFLAQWPDRVSLFERRLAPRLVEAFLRHPWVRGVQRVEILPTRQVRLQLAFRTPVLAVRQGSQVRVVDGAGVLLPAATSAADLPLYQAAVAAPQGLPGTLWGDPGLAATAQTLEQVQQAVGELRCVAATTTSRGDVVLTAANGMLIFWGRPAGAEASGEPIAQDKCERLQQHLQHAGARAEIDLSRPPQREATPATSARSK
jgi:hypothetical protein